MWEDSPLAETDIISAAIAVRPRVRGRGARSSNGHAPLRRVIPPALEPWQSAIKRGLDVLGAVAGLILLSPLLAVLVVIVKVDSPGPALFSQMRVGLGGRPFRMFKFRTMRDGADAEKESMAALNVYGDPRLFKIPRDPRVTRLGQVLRRWSLDELPQLYSVLVGHMSLVGPRPCVEPEFIAYEPHHLERLAVLPGITGLWQVSGRSDIVDFEDVVRFDCEYIENWSLGLDLRILARTLPAVISRRGAY
ncbi:MAG TPA: sugar transferase [Gemmatimonadaceae bacterium]